MIDPYKALSLCFIIAFAIFTFVGWAMQEAENKRLKRQLKLTKTCLKDTWKINRELKAENAALKFEIVYHEITNHYPPEK